MTDLYDEVGVTIEPTLGSVLSDPVLEYYAEFTCNGERYVIDTFNETLPHRFHLGKDLTVPENLRADELRTRVRQICNL